MTPVRAFVIAGTRSGCGKTSVALGVMGALARRGLAVSPFKAGPDFIDPGHHERAAALGGRPARSHNLDGWMLGHEGVGEVFARHGHGDVAVVEGVMGLYDGFSATDEAGSTAQLAKLLGLPVILVADVASMARSAAALVGGYARFDPGVRIAGVVLNRVAGASHAALVREALEHALPGVPVLGCPHRDASIELPSRHLGLVTAGEEQGDAPYHALADWAEAHLDLDRLLELAAEPSPSVFSVAPAVAPPDAAPRARIGVARDEAFCFYYHENLRLLREAGAELVEFSPLRSKHLPENLGGLYLGGGYPELYGFELGQNATLRREVLEFSRSGRPVYAECGGFLYLLRSLVGPHGRSLSMCGVFDAGAVMQEGRSALGYREVTLERETSLGPAGTIARGHEFHYSRLGTGPANAEPAYAVRGRAGALPPEGWLIGNTLGSYVHLHFGSHPGLASHFVQSAGR
ncbi:MAG: cobyrinate a,c-diamide synthase [Desulfovibrionaceae bacterium]